MISEASNSVFAHCEWALYLEKPMTELSVLFFSATLLLKWLYSVFSFWECLLEFLSLTNNYNNSFCCKKSQKRSRKYVFLVTPVEKCRKRIYNRVSTNGDLGTLYPRISQLSFRIVPILTLSCNRQYYMKL